MRLITNKNITTSEFVDILNNKIFKQTIEYIENINLCKNYENQELIINISPHNYNYVSALTSAKKIEHTGIISIVEKNDHISIHLNRDGMDYLLTDGDWSGQSILDFLSKKDRRVAISNIYKLNEDSFVEGETTYIFNVSKEYEYAYKEFVEAGLIKATESVNKEYFATPELAKYIKAGGDFSPESIKQLKEHEFETKMTKNISESKYFVSSYDSDFKNKTIPPEIIIFWLSELIGGYTKIEKHNITTYRATSSNILLANINMNNGYISYVWEGDTTNPLSASEYIKKMNEYLSKIASMKGKVNTNLKAPPVDEHKDTYFNYEYKDGLKIIKPTEHIPSEIKNFWLMRLGGFKLIETAHTITYSDSTYNNVIAVLDKGSNAVSYVWNHEATSLTEQEYIKKIEAYYDNLKSSMSEKEIHDHKILDHDFILMNGDISLGSDKGVINISSNGNIDIGSISDKDINIPPYIEEKSFKKAKTPDIKKSNTPLNDEAFWTRVVESNYDKKSLTPAKTLESKTKEIKIYDTKEIKIYDDMWYNHMTDLKKSFSDILKENAITASYSVAATQVNKLVVTNIINLLKNKTDNEQMENIASFLHTEYGSSLISMLLGLGINYMPSIESNGKIDRLAEELRINAMANVGNELISELTTALLPTLTDMFSNLPQLEDSEKVYLEKEISKDTAKLLDSTLFASDEDELSNKEMTA